MPISLSLPSCTVPNPRYCDEDEDCAENHFCDLSVNRCVPSDCGNGVLERGEECDGAGLNNQTCQDFGFDGGQLGCSDQCEFDFQNCTECGNGVMEPGEDCDGTDFGGQTCTTAANRQQGDLACTDQCQLDISNCHTCGDGTIEGPEECDGQSLGGETCATRGHVGGDLACANCMFDETGCHDCGDSTCDLSGGEDHTTCPADCGWATISAGWRHTCATKNDGTVWCWGDNQGGQLGDNATHQDCGGADCSPTPVQATGLTGAVFATAGKYHSCAQLGSGVVWCWGNNLRGQLGNDTLTNSATPVQVVNLADVVVMTPNVLPQTGPESQQGSG